MVRHYMRMRPGRKKMIGGYLPDAPGGPRNKVGAIMSLLKRAGAFLAKSGVLSRIFKRGSGMRGMLGYAGRRRYRRRMKGSGPGIVSTRYRKIKQPLPVRIAY